MSIDEGSSAGHPDAAAIASRQRQMVERALGEWGDQLRDRVAVVTGGARGIGQGRLYHVPEWNYDHGYGNHDAWKNHQLPADMEQRYSELEAATPEFARAGVPHLPFDAQTALLSVGFAELRAQRAQADGAR